MWGQRRQSYVESSRGTRTGSSLARTIARGGASAENQSRHTLVQIDLETGPDDVTTEVHPSTSDRNIHLSDIFLAICRGTEAWPVDRQPGRLTWHTTLFMEDRRLPPV